VRKLLALLFAFTLCCIADGVHAAETGKASVSGFVYDADDGETLISATVYLLDHQIGAVSNLSGYYVLLDLDPGRYMLVCTYIGYRTSSQEIVIPEGSEGLVLDLHLEPESIETEGIIIRADSMRTVDRLFEKPISEIRLTPRQVRAIPQVAEADLLRSLQSLPGILPLSDFSSALYVRGGTPDQNLYLIDGTDVYNPEHTFGIFSTFNTDAIKQVELSKGGFGAEHGGRLSSVLDVTNLDGNREEFEGSAAISLLSAKTTLQGPLGDIGSLSGSFRRTYFDQTVGRALDEIPDYYFYDGNFKAFFDLGRDNLTISGYGGRDFLDIVFNPDATEETGFTTDWGNKTASARWTRVFTPKLFSTFWVTGSRFSSDFVLEIADVRERNFVSDLTFKGTLEHHRSRQFQTRFGFEQKTLNVQYTQVFPEGLVDIRHRPRHYVAYGIGQWRPDPLWEVEAGLRYNFFDSKKNFHNLGPRLSVKHRVTDTATLRAATGVYYQYLHRIPRFAFTDIFTVSNDHQDESRSVHAIVGWQQEFSRKYAFEVEAYFKNYHNIYQFDQAFLPELEETGHDANGDPIFTNTKGIFDRGDGDSIGLEFLLRKDSGALTGWLAYSLARTSFKFDDTNQERSFSPRHDRTSTVNFITGLDLKNGWRKLRGRPKRADAGKWSIGAGYVYGTGQPITEPGSGYLIAASPSHPGNSLEYAPTRINNVRLPAYTRFDISLTYFRDFGSWSMAPYVQLFNAGNRRNIWFIDYDFANGRPDTDTVGMMPLLPTLGVDFTF
jgi:hypothetical protein